MGTSKSGVDGLVQPTGHSERAAYVIRVRPLIEVEVDGMDPDGMRADFQALSRAGGSKPGVRVGQACRRKRGRA